MRIRTLDAVRGLAALSVMFFHCYQVYPDRLRFGVSATQLSSWGQPWAWLRYTPLHLLVLGHPAVVVFFVLSGYVLALPFLSGAQPSYLRYLVKRVCRLYVPFAVAIFLSAALFAAIAPAPIPGLGETFTEQSWSHPIGGRDLLAHLAMTGFARDQVLDAPMWSLVHEMRISVIFPLLVMVAALGAAPAIALALACFAACSWGVAALGEESAAGTLLASGTCILFFVAGILLARHADAWQPRLRGLDARLRLLLWGGSLAALLFPGALLAVARLFWTAGAVGVISLCLTSPAAGRALDWAPLQWLGRISYSLYLLHLVVLVSLVYLLHGRVPLPLILLAAPLLSLASADLMFRYVEEPARQLGRRIAAGRSRPVTMAGAIE